MEFFCYHRDRPGSVALREELLEEHRSYMDRYATEMIARGPTLASDGDTPTGSVHIVDLPDRAAARAFAFDEPNYQAGVYRDVLLRRWRNTLGRTMWDFPGGRTGGNRYLVLGLGTGQAADLAVPPDRDELIAYGPLLSDNTTSWLGTAVLVRAPDPDTARAVLTPDRYADIEVHNWQFGGRPSRTEASRASHRDVTRSHRIAATPPVRRSARRGWTNAQRLRSSHDLSRHWIDEAEDSRERGEQPTVGR